MSPGGQPPLAENRWSKGGKTAIQQRMTRVELLLHQDREGKGRRAVLHVPSTFLGDLTHAMQSGEGPLEEDTSH